MDKIKEEAKKQKEQEELMKNLSEEEIQKMQEEIPEFKRRALAIKKDEDDKEKISLWGVLKEKVGDTEAMKKLKESADFKDLKDFSKDVKEFTNVIKEEMDANANPTVSKARELLDIFNKGTVVAECISEMKKFDPTFDIFEFTDEMEIIFMEMYNAYLKGNKEYVEKVCGEIAMAWANTEFKRREAGDFEPLMKELIFMGKMNMITARKMEKELPIFIFSIDISELFCNISKKDRSVVEGNPGYVKASTFLIGVQRHPNPDLAMTGHYWRIREIEQTGIYKQIV